MTGDIWCAALLYMIEVTIDPADHPVDHLSQPCGVGLLQLVGQRPKPINRGFILDCEILGLGCRFYCFQFPGHSVPFPSDIGKLSTQ